MTTQAQLIEARQAVMQCLADLGELRKSSLWVLMTDEDGIETIAKAVEPLRERLQKAHAAITAEGFCEAIARGNLEYGTPATVSLKFQSVMYGGGSGERMIPDDEEISTPDDEEISIHKQEQVFPNWHVAAFVLVEGIVSKIGGVLGARHCGAATPGFYESRVRELLEMTVDPQELDALSIRVFNESVQAVNCFPTHEQTTERTSRQTLPRDGEKLEPENVPAAFRKGGKLSGEILTAPYLKDDADWFLEGPYLTKNYGEGKKLTRRIKVGNAYAYLYTELLELRDMKTANEKDDRH